MLHILRLILCFLFIPITAAVAVEVECNESLLCSDTLSFVCEANLISLGPELYRVYRAKHGGTKQDGNALGIRMTYDYIKRYNIYCGAQAFYGSGILKGHSGSGDKIRSRLTDAQGEAVLGYTFQTKCFPHIAFIPYFGGGYFKEVNNFTDPSPIPVKFTTRFPFVAFGFLSSIYVTPCTTVGLDARFRFPWEARCKVTGDPDFDDITQHIGNELQYRIEVPLTYIGTMNLWWGSFEISLVPFYERRLYGARENYPFDFYETRFNIYGINARLIYAF